MAEFSVDRALFVEQSLSVFSLTAALYAPGNWHMHCGAGNYFRREELLPSPLLPNNIDGFQCYIKHITQEQVHHFHILSLIASFPDTQKKVPIEAS